MKQSITDDPEKMKLFQAQLAQAMEA